MTTPANPPYPAPRPDAPRGWVADKREVARLSAEHPRLNFDESRVPEYRLPDPLSPGDADPVTTAEDWERRGRPATLDLFRDHVYGRSPGRPETVRYDVTAEDARAMGGRATMRHVRLTLGQGGRSRAFGLLLFVPNDAPRPAPAFLLIDHRGASSVDPERRERDPFWPAEEIVSRGYATLALDATAADPDHPDGYDRGVRGLMRDALPPDETSWGALAAWAWSASRALDYLETVPPVDAARVAVVGHSRGGKAALWAAAEDERFALAVSNDSGKGGAALTRRDYGESVGRITSHFPHWFAGRFASYAGREADLPVDQHQLIGLIAPRAAYVASADADLWADPRGEWASLAAANPVYALHGDAPLDPTVVPPPGVATRTARRGHHLRPGGHDLTPLDWHYFSNFADALYGR